MQAGTQLWKLRRNPGRKRKFRTAAALAKACVEYFEWIEANPWKEQDDFHYQGDVIEHDKPLLRAMTITGLCLHLGVTTKCWRQWRSKDNAKDDKSAEDWKEVIEWAEAIIWEQKFTAAACGLLKENIVARELGLQERIANLHGGSVKADIGLDDATRIYLETINGSKTES